jgi:hypothetical protein
MFFSMWADETAGQTAGPKNGRASSEKLADKKAPFPTKAQCALAGLRSSSAFRLGLLRVRWLLWGMGRRRRRLGLSRVSPFLCLLGRRLRKCRIRALDLILLRLVLAGPDAVCDGWRLRRRFGLRNILRGGNHAIVCLLARDCRWLLFLA